MSFNCRIMSGGVFKLGLLRSSSAMVCCPSRPLSRDQLLQQAPLGRYLLIDMPPSALHASTHSSGLEMFEGPEAKYHEHAVVLSSPSIQGYFKRPPCSRWASPQKVLKNSDSIRIPIFVPAMQSLEQANRQRLGLPTPLEHGIACKLLGTQSIRPLGIAQPAGALIILFRPSTLPGILPPIHIA